MIKETVINGRDNSLDLLFKADGVAQNLSSVTKVELVDQEGEIDPISSEDHPTWFIWDLSETGQRGKMIIRLGAAELTARTYIFRVVLYDSVNTNGIFWGRILVNVI